MYKGKSSKFGRRITIQKYNNNDNNNDDDDDDDDDDHKPGASSPNIFFSL